MPFLQLRAPYSLCVASSVFCIELGKSVLLRISPRSRTACSAAMQGRLEGEVAALAERVELLLQLAGIDGVARSLGFFEGALQLGAEVGVVLAAEAGFSFDHFGNFFVGQRVLNEVAKLI
jgi:hypothetical protein